MVASLSLSSKGGLVRLSELTHVHLIGGGGVGMSGLGLLLRQCGIAVSASDARESDYLSKLAQAGATVWLGSQPDKIPAGAQVFYSTAIKADHPERRFADEQGLLCQSRHSLLAAITENYYTIAVAGAHGKTTTSAWLACVLEDAGLDPTALIGGTVPRWNSNFRAGNGRIGGKPLLVMEADESDSSFLHIHSAMAVITNIDLDHTDHFENLQQVEQSFLQFAEQCRANGGQVIASLESLWFLEKYAIPHNEKTAALRIIKQRGEGPRLYYDAVPVPVGLPGLHNLQNASAVLAAAMQLAPVAQLIPLMNRFYGVKRRLQKLGDVILRGKRLAIIDDYAHHPRELAATLGALQPQYDDLFLAWEPHRLSRLAYFGADFLKVLKDTSMNHRTVLLPIYAAGDNPENFPSAREYWAQLCCECGLALEVFDPLLVQEFLNKKMAVDGRTAIVFAGAGESSRYARELLEFMREK